MQSFKPLSERTLPKEIETIPGRKELLNHLEFFDTTHKTKKELINILTQYKKDPEHYHQVAKIYSAEIWELRDIIDDQRIDKNISHHKLRDKIYYANRELTQRQKDNPTITIPGKIEWTAQQSLRHSILNRIDAYLDPKLPSPEEEDVILLVEDIKDQIDEGNNKIAEYHLHATYEQILRKAIEDHPKQSIRYETLIQNYLASGNPTQAFQIYDIFVKNIKRSLNSQVLLASIYANQNNYTQATQIIEDALINFGHQ